MIIHHGPQSTFCPLCLRGLPGGHAHLQALAHCRVLDTFFKEIHSSPSPTLQSIKDPNFLHQDVKCSPIHPGLHALGTPSHTPQFFPGLQSSLYNPKFFLGSLIKAVQDSRWIEVTGLSSPYWIRFLGRYDQSLQDGECLGTFPTCGDLNSYSIHCLLPATAS